MVVYLQQYDYIASICSHNIKESLCCII